MRISDWSSDVCSSDVSIPVRGDGTIDSEEEKIVGGITRWMERNGDAAIYGSRPWRIFGEGPTAVPTGVMNEGEAKPFTAEDVRFTTRDGALHADRKSTRLNSSH